MEKTVKFTGMNDYLFKKIFKKKNILKEYLRILGIDVKEEDIIYEDVEVKGELKIKAVRFDIRIKALKMRINLEGQKNKIFGKSKEGIKVKYNEYQNHRKIHYASKLHSEAYKEGEKYFEKANTKVIFLLDYDTEGEGIQHTKYKNIETEEIYEDIEVIEVFLPKMSEGDTIESKMFDVLREKEIGKYLKEKGIVGEVANMIYEINDEEKERLSKIFEEDLKREYEDMLTLTRYDGYYDGLEKGKEEGIEEGIYQTARNFKALGVDIDTIIKATGLSKEEIEKL